MVAITTTHRSLGDTIRMHTYAEDNKVKIYRGGRGVGGGVGVGKGACGQTECRLF